MAVCNRGYGGASFCELYLFFRFVFVTVSIVAGGLNTEF